MAKGWWGAGPHRQTPILERVWDKIDGPWVDGVEWDDCWLYTGGWRSRQGYGRISAPGRSGRSLQAHIVVFEQFFGRLAPGHIIRHACDVRLCCNPFHHAPGSHAENHRDMWDKAFAWACTPLGEAPRRSYVERLVGVGA